VLATHPERRRQRWLIGFSAFDSRSEDRAYAALLDALARDLLTADAVETERHATALRSPAAVDEEKVRAAREEFAEARRELDAFRDALNAARARSGPDGTGEVPYDARDPEQDIQADLLIRYLVRLGYAEVRTEEPEPGTYVYRIRVDWGRLRELAREQGHPLPL
jgi:hypothetical protein